MMDVGPWEWNGMGWVECNHGTVLGLDRPMGRTFRDIEGVAVHIVCTAYITEHY